MQKLKSLFGGQLPELVLFDLDGTLVDSAPGLTRAVNFMLEHLGLPVVGVDKVRGWIGRGARELVAEALTEASAAPETAELERALAIYFDGYSAACESGSELYPSTLECLQKLAAAGVNMAVVTNKTERFVAPILAQLQIDSYFQLIVGGDTTARQKPDPLPLIHAAAALKVDLSRVLMVGDSRHDIRAAQAAGVPVVAVTYGYNHGDCVTDFAPDWVIDSLSELTA